ncbi:MAG: DUF2797 domain-containing protein [Gammaproteobacteria bacterium]|nr:DUF2797 domain-containing protein [Gammaproteobacteria bacterium]MCW8922769.1 DUF2797 domain-containing protein [Gammaproteobacteria bacterium]
MQGNIKKMKVALASPVNYHLPIGDELISMNELIGKKILLEHSGEINCVSCGRKTSKSYAQGHCYPCFRDLAECDMCIMKPETCHYDAGTCREPEWGEQHCMQVHYVYLANSSGVKVGITRGTQIPTRWIDQGAGQALPIFKVATRLQSGLLEVELKKHVSDRTDWRKMLKGSPDSISLAEVRDRIVAESASVIDELKQQFGADAIEFLPDAEQLEIQYPIANHPEKVKSLNFDKQEKIEGVLQGIKGQYLVLDCGVLNIRKFSGYNLALSVQ